MDHQAGPPIPGAQSTDGVSGVRPRWYAHHPRDSLAVACFIAACSLHLENELDDTGATVSSIGSSAIRAAAWLRARGIAVGHAAATARMHGPDGGAYERLAATVISRTSGKTAFTFAELKSAKIASWLAPDRVPILLVGRSWLTSREGSVHAVVMVGANAGTATLFDPAGNGEVDEIPFAALDELRAEPIAGWEILLAASPTR